MKSLIRKILKEDKDWGWADIHDDNDNHAIDALAKLEHMKELFSGLEGDLEQMDNPVVSKKMGLGRETGVEPLVNLRRSILNVENILKRVTNGFKDFDWKKLVVSK